MEVKKVLIADKIAPEGLEEFSKVEGIHAVVKTGLSKETLLKAITEFEGLVVRSATRVTEDILKAGIKLKVIGRAGAGVDNIDVREATQ